LRLIDSCITQLKAQGPYRTCNESKEEKKLLEEDRSALLSAATHRDLNKVDMTKDISGDMTKENLKSFKDLEVKARIWP